MPTNIGFNVSRHELLKIKLNKLKLIAAVEVDFVYAKLYIQILSKPTLMNNRFITLLQSKTPGGTSAENYIILLQFINSPTNLFLERVSSSRHQLLLHYPTLFRRSRKRNSSESEQAEPFGNG